MVDTGTGKLTERRLEHENGEAERFYVSLPKGTLVGIEATGCTQWFERLMAECGHELWVGDPAEIRARRVRQQKTDERDARHLLDLLLTNRFPRVWVPSPAERDARQLLQHRHKLVQLRTSVKNQLHALAMGQGLCRKRQLWSQSGRQQLEALQLGPWASERRKELLALLDQLNPQIAALDQAVETEGRAASGGGAPAGGEGGRSVSRLGLRAHAGSGEAVSALAPGGELPGIESPRGE
jgi:transposase